MCTCPRECVCASSWLSVCLASLNVPRLFFFSKHSHLHKQLWQYTFILSELPGMKFAQPLKGGKASCHCVCEGRPLLCHMPATRQSKQRKRWYLRGQEEALQTLIISVPPSFPGLSGSRDKFGGRRKDNRYIANRLINSEHKATRVTGPREHATGLRFTCWIKATRARGNGGYCRSISMVLLDPLRPSGRRVVLLFLQELLRTYCVSGPEALRRDRRWLVDPFFLSHIRSTNTCCCLSLTTSRR